AIFSAIRCVQYSRIGGALEGFDGCAFDGCTMSQFRLSGVRELGQSPPERKTVETVQEWEPPVWHPVRTRVLMRSGAATMACAPKCADLIEFITTVQLFGGHHTDSVG